MEEDSAMAEAPAEAASDELVTEEVEDAMEDGEADVVVDRLASASTPSNFEILDEFIRFGTIAPQLTLEQAIEAGVSAECADTVSVELSPEQLDLPLFDIAFLDEDGLSEPRLLLIQFFDDETTRTLDAEDCALLR